MAAELAELNLIIRSDQAEKAARRLKELGIEGVRAERAARGVRRAFGSANASAAGLARTVKSLVAGFVGLVAVRNAINTIAAFEETMVTVGAVVRASAEEFERLEATALRLGATTRFTATQAGEGLLNLSRAGLSATESINAVPHALNLAQAGMLGLAESSELTANVLRQFRLDSAETERVVDALLIVSNRAATTVTELGEAFKLAGPIAATAGVALEETAAALGVMADSGIKASLGGTALRGTVAKLADPTDEAKRAMLELGIAFEDVNPEEVGLIQALRKLQEANLTAADAFQIFDLRAAAGAIQIVQNVDKVESLIKAQERLRGETDEMARAMDDTLRGALKSTASAFEALILEVGDQGVSKSFRTMLETITQALRVLAGVKGAAEDASRAASILVTTIRILVVLFASMIASRIVAFFISLAISIGRAVTSMKALTTVIRANPIGILTIALAAGTLAFTDFAFGADEAAEKTDKFSDRVNSLVEELNDASDRLRQAFELKDIADQVSAVSQRLEALKRLRVEAVRGIREDIPQLFTLGQIFNLEDDAQKSRALALANDFRLQLETQLKLSPEALGFSPDQAESFKAQLREQLRIIEREIAFGRLESLEVLSPEQAVAELADRIRVEKELLAVLQEQVDATRQRDESTRAEIEQLSAGRRQEQATEALLEQIRLKGDLIGKSEQEQETILFLRDAEELLRREYKLTEDQIEAILDEARNALIMNQLHAESLEELKNKSQEFTDKLKEEDEQRKNQIESVEAYIDQLRAEVQFLSLSESEREIAIAQRQAEAAATKLSADELRDYLAEIRRLVEERQRLQKATGRGDLFSRTINELQQERELLQLTHDERERRRAQLILESRLRRSLTEEEAQQFQQEFEALESAARRSDLFDQLGQAAGQAFERMITGAASARAAIGDLLRDIQRLLVRRFVTEQIANTISSGLGNLFGGGGLNLDFNAPSTAPSPGAIGPRLPSGAFIPSAHGNVFDQGRLVPFQRGGVIDRLISFPLADGRRGIAGESGPEAILPLTRTPSGDLGVKSADGDQRTTQVQNVTINFTVNAKDADSFRRSMAQIRRDMQRAVKGF